VATQPRSFRRGLPRIPGGDSWPAVVAAVTDAAGPVIADPIFPDLAVVVDPTPAAVSAPASVRAEAWNDAGTAPRSPRQGLPRVAGGEPWPAAFAAHPAAAGIHGDVEETAAAVPARRMGLPRAATTAASQAVAAPVAAPTTPAATSVDPAPHPLLPSTRTEQPEIAAQPTPPPNRDGRFSRGRWARAVMSGVGLMVAAGMVVALTRWFLSAKFMQDFLATYPGEYELPVGAPAGVPTWLGWQHFFTVFLMVLIIRSGLGVRTEKRPALLWSPRNNSDRKISMSLWFHQALDILWILNGIVFIVLLFVTGQWMKIVPTSWTVIPNAVSAGLQYMALDWPTENGWVNYNSLQQLAYFATVFLAAPLAIASGVRMSHVWPKKATRLSRAYPIEWARAVHFPVMIYFVVFIVMHVALVFATGMLRNLNHMYAGQDAVSWDGFWIFAASLVVIASGWIAARPVVLVPIARLFGKVSRG